MTLNGSNVSASMCFAVTASVVMVMSRRPTRFCSSIDAASAGLLKRLSKAIADGDTIRAIVRSSGVNQDGKTPGITMPSAAAQAALIRQCYQESG